MPVLEVLRDFPGFAVRYDAAAQPFFKPIVVDNLRLLKSVTVGQKLLKLIEDARPRSRDDFPDGVNVIVERQEMTVVQSGYRRDFANDGSRVILASAEPKHAPPGCPFWKVGGSANEAKDPIAACDDRGSVCIMKFTSTEVFTNKGEATKPFIVLAHELIHSWHCLYGIRKDGPDEELWTTGIGNYEKHPWNPRNDIDISENIFRDEFGIKRRERYF